jgi:hypothetical protein
MRDCTVHAGNTACGNAMYRGIRGAVNVVGHVETEKGFRPFDGADVLDRWNMIGLRRRVVQVPAGPDHISCFLPRLRWPGRL